MNRLHVGSVALAAVVLSGCAAQGLVASAAGHQSEAGIAGVVSALDRNGDGVLTAADLDPGDALAVLRVGSGLTARHLVLVASGSVALVPDIGGGWMVEAAFEGERQWRVSVAVDDRGALGQGATGLAHVAISHQADTLVGYQAAPAARLATSWADGGGVVSGGLVAGQLSVMLREAATGEPTGNEVTIERFIWRDAPVAVL